MDIVIPQPNVSATGTRLQISLSDRGAAFVSIIFQIGSLDPIEFNDTFSGEKVLEVRVRRGQYRCSLQITAFKHGSLAPTYNSRVAINDTAVAQASGAIPSGTGAESAFSQFNLTVN